VGAAFECPAGQRGSRKSNRSNGSERRWFGVPPGCGEIALAGGVALIEAEPAAACESIGASAGKLCFIGFPDLGKSATV
jgi:hypothetical protein